MSGGAGATCRLRLLVLLFAFIHPVSSLRTSLSSIARRDALRLAAVSAATSVAAPAYADEPVVKLSRKQIEAKLSKLPVIALVNEEDAPFLTGGGGRIGYFFLDPTVRTYYDDATYDIIYAVFFLLLFLSHTPSTLHLGLTVHPSPAFSQEALLSLRVLQKTSPEARIKVVTLPEVYFPLVRSEQADLGGDLRLRPSRRQVVLANRALQSNVKQGTFMPTILDEEKGQVPIFYSERVAFGGAGEQTFPFFLVKEDLDAAYEQLVSEGGVPGVKPGSSNGEGIPIGLVRVATLDGLVDQMTSGAVDLSQAVIVGSRQALLMVKQLAQEGSMKQ